MIPASLLHFNSSLGFRLGFRLGFLTRPRLKRWPPGASRCRVARIWHCAARQALREFQASNFSDHSNENQNTITMAPEVCWEDAPVKSPSPNVRVTVVGVHHVLISSSMASMIISVTPPGSSDPIYSRWSTNPWVGWSAAVIAPQKYTVPLTPLCLTQTLSHSVVLQ